MVEMTCVVCPMSCRLTVDRTGENDISVSGNRCPRGAVYAREELLAPKRVVTATCRAIKNTRPPERPTAGTAGPARRIPCRSAAPFPKELVDQLLREIYALEVPLPVRCGQVLIENALGTGIDVIAARTLE
jgi:CxxC motif-containing protein